MKLECIRTTDKIILEIPNPKHCFLKGKNIYNDKYEYLGIFLNNDETGIYLEIDDNRLHYNKFLCERFLTMDLKQFVEDKKDVEIIQQSEFEEKINKILKEIKIKLP